MTSVSNNLYINNLDDIVNKYNIIYRRTIKMKPADLKSGIYIDFNKKNNKENPKSKVGKHAKSIFTKGYVPNWFKEVFVIT